MSEAQLAGVREQINFNTKLLQLLAAVLALIGSGLIAQIKEGVFDILFGVGTVTFMVILAIILWLFNSNRKLIKTMRQPK